MNWFLVCFLFLAPRHSASINSLSAKGSILKKKYTSKMWWKWLEYLFQSHLFTTAIPVLICQFNPKKTLWMNGSLTLNNKNRSTVLAKPICPLRTIHHKDVQCTQPNCPNHSHHNNSIKNTLSRIIYFIKRTTSTKLAKPDYMAEENVENAQNANSSTEQKITVMCTNHHSQRE